MHYGLYSLIVLVIASSGCVAMLDGAVPLTKISENKNSVVLAGTSPPSSISAREAHAIQLANCNALDRSTEIAIESSTHDVQTVAFTTTEHSSRRQRDQLFAQYQKHAQEWLIQRELDSVIVNRVDLSNEELGTEPESESASRCDNLLSMIADGQLPETSPISQPPELSTSISIDPMLLLTVAALAIGGMARPFQRLLHGVKSTADTTEHERRPGPHHLLANAALTIPRLTTNARDRSVYEVPRRALRRKEFTVVREEPRRICFAQRSLQIACNRALSVIDRYGVSVTDYIVKSSIRIGRQKELACAGHRKVRYTGRGLKGFSTDLALPNQLEGLLVLKTASTRKGRQDSSQVWGVVACQIMPDNHFTARLVPMTEATFNSPRC